MILRKADYTLFGCPVIVTDMVKRPALFKSGLYKFEGKILVHPDWELNLLARVISQQARTGRTDYSCCF